MKCIAGSEQVESKHCDGLQPVSERECNLDLCPSWKYSSWTACSASCGTGSQTRTASCQAGSKVVSDDECDSIQRQPTSQTCLESVCPIWVPLNWSICSKSCDTGKRHIIFECKKNGTVVPSSLCNENTRKQATEDCNTKQCPKWVKGEWSQCSASCGGGVQTR